jgi:hypothetical protein
MPLAIPPLLVAFGFLCAAVVVYGMTHSSNETVRPQLRVSTPLRKKILRGFLFGVTLGTSEAIRAGERYIRAHLSHWAVAKTRALAAWFGGLTALALGVAHEIEELGLGIEHGVRDLTQRWIPREIHKKVQPVERTAADARGRAQAAQHGIDRERRQRGKETGALGGVIFGRLFPKLHGIEHGIRTNLQPKVAAHGRTLHDIWGRDLPRIRSRTKAVEDQVHSPSRAWLKRIGAALWATSLFGLMVRYLVRRFPWLYCRNVNRLARTVCGLPTNTVDNLILGLLGAIAVSDLRTVVHFAQEAEEEAVQELRRLLNAL